MAMQQIVSIAGHYFNRHRFCEQIIGKPPPADLGIVVVIPCANERSIAGVVRSILDCKGAGISVEVMVVVNAPENAPAAFIERNKGIVEYLRDVEMGREDITIHTIVNNDLPVKHAGVGLARKIGLDEALQRFEAIDKDGILLCLDADCIVDSNYLQSTWQFFKERPDVTGCSLYFEHPIENGNKDIVKAMKAYELHLRLYRFGLQTANLPFAFHTVGSSMAFRASAYALHGGMNRRKAGEDFYFLQKLIKSGHYDNCLGTCVYPASRTESLLPFGTAASIRKIMAGDGGTYHPDIYQALGDFAEQVGSLAEKPIHELAIHPSLISFLTRNKVEMQLETIRNNTRKESFVKRFFHWFDAFMVLKFAHYYTGYIHGKVPLSKACESLSIGKSADTLPMLELLRDLDKSAENAKLVARINREIYA